MVRGRWCFCLWMPNFFIVCSLMRAIEQPVSSSTRMGCFALSWCSIMVMIGRAPDSVFDFFLDWVPPLGSSFFRFVLDKPHTIRWVLKAGLFP